MSIMMWKPADERVKQANMTRFLRYASKLSGTEIADYSRLWQWSVDQPHAFWSGLWDFLGIAAEKKGDIVVDDISKMPGATWFPEARLNFAENLLRRRDDGDALVFWGEDKVKRRLSWGQLYDLVSRLSQALLHAGVKQGDRVAGFMPNMPETVAFMLATSAIGAIWSSASPDFGVQGVVDRFGQIEPKIMVAAEGYYYSGKAYDCLGKLAEIVPKIPSIERVIIIPYTRNEPDLSALPTASMLEEIIAPFAAQEIDFTRLPFAHPLYIMFSSGTTGVPKCIIHSAGGCLLQQLKEHVLHCDAKPNDRLFYFTTCGWMMWNWLMAGLAAEASLLLYDGNPSHKDGNILWDLAQAESCTFFGTSAKWLDAQAKANMAPIRTHDLSALRAIASTGSVLSPESFDYVYSSIKADVHLASISGGTDIVSCFMLGNPIAPVYRGEIQARGLGLKVEIFNEDGQAVQGQKGELVCTQAFPAMPLGFWNDPTGAKYRAAYFEKYPHIWTHGDWVELTEHQGIIVYGRSDATLNPGGVRIGTAEIYRQVEQLPEILESIVIGQDWDNDVRVVLFVRLQEGLSLNDELIARIKQKIRDNTTPRHVPARIVQVADIPRTKSGKIVELAVREIVHGRAVKNKDSLANPEALELYRDLPLLAS